MEGGRGKTTYCAGHFHQAILEYPPGSRPLGTLPRKSIQDETRAWRDCGYWVATLELGRHRLRRNQNRRPSPSLRGLHARYLPGC